jgi:hypothetical protein
MANVKISGFPVPFALPSAAALNGSEVFPADQTVSGFVKTAGVSVAQLATYLGTGGGLVSSVVGTTNEIAVSTAAGVATVSFAPNVVIPTPSSGVAFTVNGNVYANNVNQQTQSLLGVGFVAVTLGSTTFYKIASLPVSASATYDSITIRASLNDAWGASNTTRIDATFGNRNGFSYNFTSSGSQRSQSAIKCYTEASGAVTVYLVASAGTYCYVYADVFATSTQVTLYPSLPTTTSPTGTLSFDTTNYSAYPPKWYATDGRVFSLTGTAAGTPALSIATSATTGAQTATFSATNKPGAATQTSPTKWLPVTLDGTTYYIPAYS